MRVKINCLNRYAIYADGEKIGIDTTPTSGSTNFVTSDGILQNKLNQKIVTISSSATVSLSLPYYRTALIGGFAQNIGAVLIALFNSNGTLIAKNLKSFDDWSNNDLTFTLSSQTLTITSSTSATSSLTYVRFGVSTV